MNHDIHTLKDVSFLLGCGLTHEEIAQKLGIHRVSVTRMKKTLREFNKWRIPQ